MVIHPSYYDVCDVIYYVIAVRARRMVRIFFLPYLGNRPKSDPCSYELFLGVAVAQWLRYCATNRKVAGSIPDGVIGIFQ